MTGERFRSRQAAGAAQAKLDQTQQILSDLHDLGSDAARIAEAGEAFFLSADGSINRHAADGILIKVQELCERLPQNYRDGHPHVPWSSIRGLRNRLGHDYRAVDYHVVWNAIAAALPAMLRHLT